MTEEASGLPSLDIAITLIRSALALLDHAHAAGAAAALQNALDIASEEQHRKASEGGAEARG